MNQNERIKNAQAQANRMRNRAMKTTIIFLVVVVGGIALFVNFLGSSSNKENVEISNQDVRTNFTNCDEIIEYIKSDPFHSYTDLQKKWGENYTAGDVYLGEYDEIWINVTWNNIVVNGKSPKVIFTAPNGKPSIFVGVDCN